MGRRWLISLAGACLLLQGIVSAADYAVDLSEASAGWLTVSARAECSDEVCEWQMPVWSATYQVRDFAQHITRVEALDAEGQALEVRRLGPSRWSIPSQQGRLVTVRYRIRADRSGPFGAYADARQVNLNLSQVLLYLVAGRDEPATLEFTNKPGDFREAVALDARTEGGYRAPSYDRLVDTPVLLARFEETSFEVSDSTVRIVAAGAPNRSVLGELQTTIRRLALAADKLMEGLPFETYTFVYVFSEEDGGGMEYRNGSIIFGPADCRQCALPGLTAHEFFHLWNVKRIRPASMEPVLFDSPIDTPLLWFAEGVTSTYAEYLQVLAGLETPNSLPGRMERLINEYESRPAMRTQSAEESGIEAWFERYPDYGRADRSVSYYLQGEIIGHLLDLAIRNESWNRASLDDVMRGLNREYAEQERPFEDLDAIERLASEAAGADMGPVIQTLVRSAEPVDWGEFLGYAGYRLAEEEMTVVEPGLTLANAVGQGVIVAELFPGGAAEKSGLRRGDRLLRVDGKRITGGSYDAMARLEELEGRQGELTIERSGRLLHLQIRSEQTRVRRLQVVSMDQLTDRQRTVRAGFLHRRTAGRSGAPASE